jgi:hypothetical protein
VRRALEQWAPFVAGAVLVVGVASYALVHFSGGSQPQVVHRPSKLEPTERRIALEFVQTAVARKRLARAWDIAAPELKRGTTREEWLAGTLRVVPYPVAKADAIFTVVNSFTDRAQLNVAFLPKPGTRVDPQTFTLDLRKVDGRWLVSAWLPTEKVRPGKGK